MIDRAADRQRRGFVRGLLSWGRANRRRFPWRGETDPFRVLVAEVLLQRSRGRTVAAVYEALFQRWPAPEQLATAPEKEIAAVIRPLGLMRRARTLKQMAREISEQGRVPRSIEGLRRLTGVGRYSAAATAAAVYGAQEPTVDATSARVYRRVLGMKSAKASDVNESLREAARAVMPRPPASREWNWAVLDLAATICLPKIPRCSDCPVSRHCHFGSSRIWTVSEG